MEYGSMFESKQINTTGWNIGTYTFSVRTEAEHAQGLDACSNTKTLAILKGEIGIEAEKAEIVKLESVKLIVAGCTSHNITISSSSPAHTIFPAGVEDNPPYTTSGFNDTLDADGVRKYVVYFNKTGLYTIKVTDTTVGSDDSVDILVLEVRIVFDTGPGTYPSIFGTHNGTITPNVTIDVSKLYTYPCPGTGGHTEYVKIWNKTWSIETTWAGYSGGHHNVIIKKRIDGFWSEIYISIHDKDWHNITLSNFTLESGEVYNYTIRTGSYPQIHHTDALPTANGWINCTEFVDANGKIYYDWIPAIKFF